MENILSNYNTKVDETAVKSAIEKIVKDSEKLYDIENLKKIFSYIDLTTLSTTDTQARGKMFADNVSNFPKQFPDMPNVAAICVYPSLVKAVKENLKVDGVNIASVVGGFPSSQTFIDVKTVETSFAFRDGATEADMVISVGEMLDGNYAQVYDEVVQIKDACGDGHLKVILETGALENLANIKIASILAMEAGGDFIKTSTGKMEPAATLEAIYVMATAVKEFYKRTNKKIGLKPAGGIGDSKTALQYINVIKTVLGDDWLTPELFRIGASSLANKVLTDINKLNGKDEVVAYF